MEYKEFRRQLGKAGLTINEYADLLHMLPKSVSNYAKKGHVPQFHAVIAVALGYAGDTKLNFIDLLARYEVFPVRSSAASKKVAILDKYRASKQRDRKKP